MTNKQKAITSLYYRIEALADRFTKASEDEAVAIARKINIYGRLKEVLEVEQAKEPKPVDTNKVPDYYNNKVGTTTVDRNGFGW